MITTPPTTQRALAHEANDLLVQICAAMTHTYNSTLPMDDYLRRLDRLRRLRTKANQRLVRRLRCYQETASEYPQPNHDV